MKILKLEVEEKMNHGWFEKLKSRESMDEVERKSVMLDVLYEDKDKAERAVERRREKKHPHKERDVLEELERELEEDPYADSEFSWLTDEPAVEAETKEEQQS